MYFYVGMHESCVRKMFLSTVQESEGCQVSSLGTAEFQSENIKDIESMTHEMFSSERRYSLTSVETRQGGIHNK
jgi:hypothetical protein